MIEDLEVGTEAKADNTFCVAGLQLPQCSLFTRQGAARTFMLRPAPSDVILSSYPTCDSPLVDLMLWRLLYTDLVRPPMDPTSGRFLPCLEMADGAIAAHARNPPRLYKTYFPFRLIPFYRQAKYVYVIRCPWDTCRDYYQFLTRADALEVPFDAFFERFLEGDVPYGSYFRHVAPWNKRLGESNVLILCSEHVEHNPRSALFKVAAFLGDPYLRLLLDKPEMETCLLEELSAIQSVECSSDRNGPLGLAGFEDRVEAFSSNGPYCNERQLSQIMRKVSQYFTNSSLEFLWTNLFQKHVTTLAL